MPLLFIALLVLPVVELWLIVQVAQEVGVLFTIALLLLVSAAGAWLLKQQGTATWRRLQETLRAGRMPTDEVTDGALILLGGALLLTPGFLSDVVGLVLLLPVSRAAIRALARRALAARVRRRFGVNVRDAEAIRVSRREPRGRDLGSPGGGASGSPDRG